MLTPSLRKAKLLHNSSSRPRGPFPQSTSSGKDCPWHGSARRRYRPLILNFNNLWCIKLPEKTNPIGEQPPESTTFEPTTLRITALAQGAASLPINVVTRLCSTICGRANAPSCSSIYDQQLPVPASMLANEVCMVTPEQRWCLNITWHSNSVFHLVRRSKCYSLRNHVSKKLWNGLFRR